MNFEDRDFNTNDVSRILKISNEQVTELIHTNKLKAKIIDNKYTFKGKDINTYLANFKHNLTNERNTISIDNFNLDTFYFIDELANISDYKNVDELINKMYDIANKHNYNIEPINIEYILHKFYDIKAIK